VKTDSKDISASSIQMNGGPNPGFRDGIGAGSFVYPSYSGDNFARFHVYWVSHNLLFGCTFSYEP
jgi:hypothetical protein